MMCEHIDKTRRKHMSVWTLTEPRGICFRGFRNYKAAWYIQGIFSLVHVLNNDTTVIHFIEKYKTNNVAIFTS